MKIKTKLLKMHVGREKPQNCEKKLMKKKEKEKLKELKIVKTNYNFAFVPLIIIIFFLIRFGLVV